MRNKIIIILAGLLFLAGCQHKIEPIQLKEYVIGDVDTIVIDEKYVQHYYAGLFMAVEEINRAGGVNGIPLKVEVKSDFANHREAYLAADYLLKQKNAIVLVGTSIPQTTFGVARYANDNKIPFLNTGSLSEEIITGSQANDFTFRVREGYGLHLKAIAEDIAQNKGLKSLVVLTYSNEDGIKQAKEFKALIKKSRPDITFAKDVYIASHKGMFDNTAKDVQYSFTGGVVILINGDDVLDVMKNLQTQRATIGKSVYLMLGGEPEWVRSLQGLTPDNWVVTGSPYYVDGGEKNREFVKKYQAKYKSLLPQHSSYIGYTTGYLIADALRKSRPTANNEKNRLALAKALESASFDSPVGLVQMRLDHQSNMGTYIGMLQPYNTPIRGSNKVRGDVRMANTRAVDANMLLESPKKVNKMRQKEIAVMKKAEANKRHITPRGEN
ncbi:MAG: ABC transporter substrate-binding protein [Alphaproteobacteria bacterium]|jgi:branched-chain amino acid transport system substrate-binding protein|nr:ABC transporter substrate-binding protein [Alphaproteobacteria bacterium]